MPWNECIEKWSENIERYYIEVEYNSGYRYTYGLSAKGFLESKERGYGISSDSILKGTWYLCENNFEV